MIITTKSGHKIEIDDSDWELVKGHSWSIAKGRKTYYAQTACGDGGYRLMHRLILQARRGEDVDHADGNGWNNKRSNLRICTRSQNQANRQKPSTETTSKYKGVYWNKKCQKWGAVCRRMGKGYWVGTFATEKDAAEAYNDKASELFGEYANLNVF